MTSAMWEVQLQRMQEEMVRRGVNPLTEQEHHLVMSYLKAHSTDAAQSDSKPRSTEAAHSDSKAHGSDAVQGGTARTGAGATDP